MDSFLEPILDIVHALLFYASKHSEFAIHNQQLVDQTGLFIRLLSHNDTQVSEKSGRVLNLICTIFSYASENVLAKANVGFLISALNNGSSTTQVFVQ